MRAAYPLILRRPETLGLSVTLDLIGQSLHLPDFAVDLSRDRYAAARVGLTWQRWFDRMPVSAQVQFSQGIGGRTATALLPVSRQGASSTFRRLDAMVGATLALPGSFGLNVAVRGQTGFGAPQFVSEQFALDAGDAVSVFTAGSFNVDSGATARSEVRLPVVELTAHTHLTPYFFAAGGRGSLARPTAAEPSTRSAGGVGAGARMALGEGRLFGGRSANIATEFGKQYSNLAGNRRGSRVNFSLSVEY